MKTSTPTLFKDAASGGVAVSNRHSDARALGQAGFSLVELLVVTALLLVVMGAIYSIWSGLERTYAFTNEDMAAQAEARAAMGEMVEYIRTARQPEGVSIPSSLDAVITNAGTHSLTLWTDTVRDGTHSLELTRFRVGADPSNPSRLVLYRDRAAVDLWVPDPFADASTSVRMVSLNIANDFGNPPNDVGHPLFTYLDAQGEPVDPAEDLSLVRIRQVVINLRVDVDPSRSPIVNVLTSIVTPRNLRQ